MLQHFSVVQVFCPYASLLLIYPELYWDNLFEYPFLWVALATHLATTVFATFIAHRRQFYRYHFDGVCSASGAFWGCLFCWLAGFPLFLRNWYLITKDKALPKKAYHPRSTTFFYTALLHTAFWSILLAMAIPSLMTSRYRVERDIAVRMLKRYAQAQNAFKAENLASVPGNTKNGRGYCDNFRNLHYGKDRNGKAVDLLYKDVTDAFAGPADGASTQEAGGRTSQAFRGFRYLDDPFIAANALWDTQFGLVGYPVNAFGGVVQLLWIGADGKILICLYESDKLDLLAAEQSPLHPEGRKHWNVLAQERNPWIDHSNPMRPQHQQSK